MQVCGECVTLYHGTSLSNAEAIMGRGFETLDVHALSDTIAARYSLAAEQVLPKDTFVNRTRSGDPLTYLTDSFAQALSYAGHTGEAEEMMLSFAYGHLHSSEPGWANVDRERDMWVRDQSDTVPAIVEVNVPRSVLNEADRQVRERPDRLRRKGMRRYPDYLLTADVVNPHIAGMSAADFCICHHQSPNRVCRRPECVVCREMEAAEVAGLDPDCIDGGDWFTCPPLLSRLDGTPAAHAGPHFSCSHQS